MGLKKQHHFVLVHGGGHGAWCWVKIVAVLEKAGHRVTAVDLASAGEDPRSADDITTFEQYNQPLEDLFASFPDHEKVILVGHSLGGMSLTRVSELFPKKISVAVYLSAFMPPPGLHLLEFMAKQRDKKPMAERRWRSKLNFKVEGGPPTSMELSYDVLKDDFYNRCSPEDLAFAAEHVKRFPFITGILAPVHCTKEKYGSVPKVYVLPTDDRATLPAIARKIIALNPPNELHEIDADHSPFFSAVETVEKILNDVAAKYDSSQNGFYQGNVQYTCYP